MNAQLRLFDTTEQTLEVAQDYLGIPGLVYCPQLVDEQEQVELLSMIDAGTWQNDLKRRVQHYGYKYDYKARRIDANMYVGPLPDFALGLGARLVERGLITTIPDQLIVNEYLPGQGITPHVDCEPCFQDEIATISLGSVYAMDLTKNEGEERRVVDLDLGSVLVFSDEARYEWKHGIKARKSDSGRIRGRRVSLTFRNVILNS